MRMGAAVIALVLALAGCSEPEDQDVSAVGDVVQKTQQVVETFNAGAGVVVRSLAIEKQANTLWVGTSAGVMEVDLGSSQVRNTFTREHGLANEYVFAIGIDSDGYKWFGTNAGGVSRYKNGEWDVYFPMHGLADYWIYAFAEQANRDYWIGTWAGVNRVKLDTMEMTTFVKELINEWVYGIDVDSQDRVWFGTEGGVSMYDGQKWRSWTHKDGMGAANPGALAHSENTGLGTRSRHDLNVLAGGGESYNPNYVFSVQVDHQDEVWFGTWGGGVARFNGSEWINYTVEDGLAGNIVYSITQDSEGTFWFGTNHGLSRFDGKNWHSYSKADGLAGNDVYAIVADANGSIWIGTQGGVSRLAYTQ